MSASNSISLVEQKAILKAVEDIPPEDWREWLKSKGGSYDQIQHWYKVKGHFKWIYQALKDYFSGNESILQDLALTSSQRDHVALLVDSYISLYGVLQWGWKYIKRFFRKLKIPFKYKTPGQLLIAILERRGAQLFCEGLMPYSNFSTTYLKKFLAQKPDQNGKAQKGKTAKGVEVWIEHHFYSKDVEQFDYLYRLCLIACEKASKSDKTMYRKLTEYDQYLNSITHFTSKHLNHTRSHQWVNGTRKEGTRGGGYS